MKPKERQTLEEILATTKDTLFPDADASLNITINSTDCMGDTPLHILVQRQNKYAVDLLIEASANVNAVGDMGETPLHIAIESKDTYIIEALLKAGARVDIRSEFNKTAKERAKEIGGEISKLINKNYVE